ncbi:MAG: adenylyltransferase/cytidyltransferase family protein [Candidatus Palauibacterales bacterium]|nr:adenylyltransferase/cytidyltransferase family protein [Candidatus Palauibacterales bacterium]MDP2483775.1 adenylyltransferase/cytidyltransferase family protein [Candidatus Palauibacterales bacterium]
MPDQTGTIQVLGSFDDLRSREVRFLQEAARLGAVDVSLLSDEAVARITGSPPAFPEDERRYVLEAIRFVSSVRLVEGPTAGLEYLTVPDSDLTGFPGPEGEEMPAGSGGRRKAIVTGCYDWLHSGHVRFFEEVAELADLYVTVGSDRNIRFLKGEGHPLFPEEERRYMVGSIRHVKKAVVATGWGWLDAEPEIDLLQPDIYAVNEDGDRPEKREFCEARGIEYRVLRRLPRAGLPARRSTDFRGF